MNTKLNHIQNWTERAWQAKWSASALAKECGVTIRTLERFFLKKFSKSPRLWLAEQRQKQAIKLLHNGSTVKEIANHLDYKTQHHFSREFKKSSGYPPSQFVIQGPA